MKAIENAAKLMDFFHPLPSYAKKTKFQTTQQIYCRLWNFHFICFPHNITKKSFFDRSSQKMFMSEVDMGTTFQKWRSCSIQIILSKAKSELRKGK